MAAQPFSSARPDGPAGTARWAPKAKAAPINLDWRRSGRATAEGGEGDAWSRGFGGADAGSPMANLMQARIQACTAQMQMQQCMFSMQMGAMASMGMAPMVPMMPMAMPMMPMMSADGVGGQGSSQDVENFGEEDIAALEMEIKAAEEVAKAGAKKAGGYVGLMARYIEDEGFGFITCAECNEDWDKSDIFVSGRTFVTSGVDVGDTVTFQVEKDGKNLPRAVNPTTIPELTKMNRRLSKMREMAKAALAMRRRFAPAPAAAPEAKRAKTEAGEVEASEWQPAEWPAEGQEGEWQQPDGQQAEGQQAEWQQAERQQAEWQQAEWQAS